jgi:hypothetical protein
LTRPCCSLGAHAQAQAIAAALGEGQSVRQVAKVFGVSKSAVSNHRQHLGQPPPEDVQEPEAVVAELVSVDSGGQDEDTGEERPSSNPEDEAPTRARDPLAGWAKEAFGIIDERARVRFITKRLLSGHEWESGHDVPALASAWGVSERAVRGYVKRAADLVTENMGDVEQARLESRTWWRHCRDDAEATAKADIPDGLPAPLAAMVSQNGPKYLALAVEAQKSLDRVTGVVQPGTNIINNIINDPNLSRVLAIFREVLQDHPDLLADFAMRIQALKNENVGVKALGGKR